MEIPLQMEAFKVDKELEKSPQFAYCSDRQARGKKGFIYLPRMGLE